MPPRTGPRRRKRIKQAPAAARHFVIVRTDDTTLVTAHRIELDDGCLILRDEHDAIAWIVAAGDWCEIRPTVIGDLPLPGSKPANEFFDEPAESAPPRIVEVDTVLARPEEERFFPSSPEEARRILMEIERRLAPDYQDPPDCASDAPPATPIRKD